MRYYKCRNEDKKKIMKGNFNCLALVKKETFPSKREIYLLLLIFPF